ncbi:MAG: hypothetical protein CM1200mP3_17760 [Chloroflexota bacterium]|nr:MAG: hypothetical protein CM1200mP3_17760 [Chloroflexota bacterium]
MIRVFSIQTSTLRTDSPIKKRYIQWLNEKIMGKRRRNVPTLESTPKIFAQWESDVLRDYCQFGLTWSNKVGSYILSCPPQVEADMYGAYIDPKILKQIPLYRNPVRILLARERTRKIFRQFWTVYN